MNATPTVSVITITRDDLPGLQRTVQSVRAQRYAGRIEHIVIDGGSGPEVREYLSRNDSWFGYWQSAPDRGRYDAMNQGIAHASGELLWFLHSADCFADPGAVAAVVDEVSRHGPVTNLWGYGIEHEIAADGSSAGFQAPMPFDMRKFLTLRGTIPHQASFFGAALVRRLGGYDLDFAIAADQLFMLRAAMLCAPVTVQRVVATFDTTGAGSVRPVGEYFRDMRRMWARAGRYPYRSAHASRAYLYCLECVVRTRLTASRAMAALS